MGGDGHCDSFVKSAAPAALEFLALRTPGLTLLGYESDALRAGDDCGRMMESWSSQQNLQRHGGNMLQRCRQQINSRMEPIVIGNSRWKYVLLLVVCLGFVAGGVFILMMDRSPKNLAGGWGCIVFFGAGVPIAVWQIFDSRPRLIIDENGINDRTMGVGLIPWSEIEDAYVMSIERNDFICLVVRDPSLWIHKLSPLQKAMASTNLKLGFTELNVNLSGIDVSSRQIHELILKMSAARK